MDDLGMRSLPTPLLRAAARIYRKRGEDRTAELLAAHEAGKTNREILGDLYPNAADGAPLDPATERAELLALGFEPEEID